ncbi:MAG: hypothetical protein DWQ53_24055 [Microcystis flos-aquae DF17]|nr:MAG: hypothetical protein DWQ53_24055 [Microcystis flos-aquae DF17]
MEGYKISSFRQRETGNFFSDHRAVGEQQLLNKYLSKINYTYLNTSCLLPLASCLSSLGN